MFIASVELEPLPGGENRIVAADFTGAKETSKAYYAYDGDGRRVRRDVEGFEVWQVYGFGGELVAEYPQTGPSLVVSQPQKEYGYRNGQLLVTAEPRGEHCLEPASDAD